MTPEEAKALEPGTELYILPKPLHELPLDGEIVTFIRLDTDDGFLYLTARSSGGGMITLYPHEVEVVTARMLMLL